MKSNIKKYLWLSVALLFPAVMPICGTTYAQGALDQATPTNDVGALLDGGSSESAGDPPAEDPSAANPAAPNPTSAQPDTLNPTPATPSVSSTPVGRGDSVPLMNDSDAEVPIGDFSAPASANDFAGASEMPGTMRTLADDEAPQDYMIEEGDTLIDICDQLLDEPGYWPKLWALNPEIKNPHFIFPHMRLRFYPGDDETPPYLQVVAEEDVVPIDKEDLEEKQLIAERVEAAERIAASKINNVGMSPEKIVTRVLRAFERAFADVIGPDQVEPLAEQPVMGGKVFDGSTLTVHIPGFIYGKELEPRGRVLAGRMGQFAVQQGDEVIVASEAGLQANAIYTVLRSTGMVSELPSGEEVGHRYEYVAKIRLDRNVGDNRFRGLVLDSRLTVMQDDLLVPPINTTRVIPINEESGPMRVDQSSIVCWENIGQENGGRGNYAFISKGRNSGVSVGATLPVFSTPGYVLGELSGLDDVVDYKKVGEMRIIDVTDVAAVGFIVKNSAELRVGDLTYKP